MPRGSVVLLALAGLLLGAGGCASSFDAVDRSAAAFAQRLEDEKRCYSRPGPNGQVTAGCAVTIHETSTTTTTTTDADGRVTTTTTRTVNGEAVPDRR